MEELWRKYNIKNILLKKKQEKKNCPILSTAKDKVKCDASNCIAWQVAFSKVEREDHSDGSLHIHEYGSKTGRRARREGPGGCSGVWILDETGYCELIQKKEEDLK